MAIYVKRPTNYIVIGSTALAFYNRARKVNDYDVVYTESYTKVPFQKVDGHCLPEHIFNLIPYHFYYDEPYATLDALYTIKLSHLSWNINWFKHFTDILWMKNNGAKLVPDLYEALKKFWVTVHGGKDFLSLNQSKDDFFNDFVDYVYDHDYLHEIVAGQNNPVYQQVLKDGQDVLIDKNKFDQLPLEQQLLMFREEITVIACERFLVPNKCNWKEAYLRALQLTVTNLTKNWATEFIIQNIELYQYPDFFMFERLIHQLNLPIPVFISPNGVTSSSPDTQIGKLFNDPSVVKTVLRTIGNLDEILLTKGNQLFRCYVNHGALTDASAFYGTYTTFQEVKMKTKTIHVYE